MARFCSNRPTQLGTPSLSRWQFQTRSSGSSRQKANFFNFFFFFYLCFCKMNSLIAPHCKMWWRNPRARGRKLQLYAFIRPFPPPPPSSYQSTIIMIFCGSNLFVEGFSSISAVVVVADRAERRGKKEIGAQIPSTTVRSANMFRLGNVVVVVVVVVVVEMRSMCLNEWEIIWSILL